MSLEITVTQDLETCYALRHEVFVVEQNVPIEEERDALDATATHLLARQDGAATGTARIVFIDDIAKVGRVCVTTQARGTGLGAALIKAAIQVASERDGIAKVKLGAQTHALGFYEKLGFTAFGPVYLDAGIEHRDMVFDLE